MGRQLTVAAVLLFLSIDAGAGPPRPERSTVDCVSENCGASQDNATRATTDYVKTLVRPVIISEIGVSVRDGRTKLIDGHEVSGAEVVDVTAESPAASAGIRPAEMKVLAPVISLLQSLDQSFIFDNSDVIFAVDGERVRNTLDLADRVASLAHGDRIYITVARRGRRVQSCITIASP